MIVAQRFCLVCVFLAVAPISVTLLPFCLYIYCVLSNLYIDTAARKSSRDGGDLVCWNIYEKHTFPA